MKDWRKMEGKMKKRKNRRKLIVKLEEGKEKRNERKYGRRNKKIERQLKK
jgi:hypothetical protein